MARVNLSVPDELLEALRRDRPGVNLSAVLQEALRGVFGCEHEVLACARCAAPIEAQALVDDALSRFYGDAIWSLDELVRRGGTAEGAARVLKRVGQRHGVSRARCTPLPRPTRANREDREEREAS